jgi:hypothetical protein
VKFNYLSIKAALFATLVSASTAAFAQAQSTLGGSATITGGSSAGPPPMITSAPEPLSWIPVGIGVVAILLYAFKARTKTSKDSD